MRYTIDSPIGSAVFAALADDGCGYCGGTGIRPGTEHTDGLVRLRNNDCVCDCLPRLPSGQVLVVALDDENRTVFESVRPPRGFTITEIS